MSQSTVTLKRDAAPDRLVHANDVATRVAAALLPHLRQTRDHIDRHYDKALDLDQLALVACTSKYHLVRSFAAAYGETPIRYLGRRRIERAQDLLRSANLTVTEICMLVGFTSLGSFSWRFTQLVGQSPRTYRDHWAARGGPHIPGCYLFMRGVVDLRGTGVGASTGPIEQSQRSLGSPAKRTVGP